MITEEQYEKVKQKVDLMAEILIQIGNEAVSGPFEHQKCMFCSGSVEGYWDDLHFEHSSHCVVLLIEKLYALHIDDSGPPIQV